jgi:hypothetical protein
MASEWITYRTRFLIKARQLDAPLTFVDAIGREHSGQKGDYLVLSSDGSQRIAPREIFEDIYVPMTHATESWTPLAQASASSRSSPQPPVRRRASPGGAFVA